MTKLNLPYDKPKKLTFKTGNPKTDKNLKIASLKKYWILRLNLAPYNLSGYNVCSSASVGCAESCLHTAGNPMFQAQKDKGRINRSRYYMQSRVEFLKQLIREIKNHEIYCNKNNFKPVVRLNTTSDISWEIHGIFELFPAIQFYDYTKIKKRVIKYLTNQYPKNYHLTFSLSEKNMHEAIHALSLGFNVAVVFGHGLPDKYLGHDVIDGTLHDLRHLDPSPVIVGLDPKGSKAKNDQSGFVIRDY